MSYLRRGDCELTNPKVFSVQIAMIRDKCHAAVEMLSRPDSLSDAHLAECLRLSDSLDVTNRLLRCAVAHVAIARRKTHGVKI